MINSPHVLWPIWFGQYGLWPIWFSVVADIVLLWPISLWVIWSVADIVVCCWHRQGYVKVTSWSTTIWSHPVNLPHHRHLLLLLSPKEGRRVEGWVDLVGWLHTEMVYPPTDGHPSWWNKVNKKGTDYFEAEKMISWHWYALHYWDILNTDNALFCYVYCLFGCAEFSWTYTDCCSRQMLRWEYVWLQR